MILEHLFKIQQDLYHQQQELWWDLRETPDLYKRFELCWRDYGGVVEQIYEDLTEI